MTPAASAALGARSPWTEGSCAPTRRPRPRMSSPCDRASPAASPKLTSGEPACAVSALTMLELDQVVKHYTDADEIVRAVDELTLTIQAGRVYALYGPSGSGKTTLLLLAAGLIRPDRGAVRFAGDDLARLSAEALASYQRREIGFIYQSPHLMTGVPAVENAA